MPPGAGIFLDGKQYNVVQDHETYVVSDVPAHPDSDSRMERRVEYDSWLKGYLKRRSAANPLDTSIYSVNIYNRIEKAGEGMWFSWGGDSRLGDRIFGQRLVSLSQTPASAPILFGDGSVYSYIICKQHVYAITGVINGVQQIVLSKDFSVINPAVQIVDAIAFNGRVYIATCQLTNSAPDFSKAQVEWVWDQNSTTTNWTNPPTALPQVTFPASATTTLASPVSTAATTITPGAVNGLPGTQIATASDGAALPQGTINVNSTYGFAASGTFYTLNAAGAWQTIAYTGITATTFTGCTGGSGNLKLGNPVQNENNFNVTIDSEIMTIKWLHTATTVFQIVTRGIVGSPTAAHQTGATITYNPAIAVNGTSGQVKWSYQVITALAGQDAVLSSVQSITVGPAQLTNVNSVSVVFNTVSGQTYSVFRTYAGGSPNSVGLVQSGIAGTGNPVTFTDTGLSVTSLHYQVTPQFAIGDLGNASAFAVIRNVLWRAAGAKMWAWDGQQGTWSGETVVGDPSTNITGLDVYQDGIIIFKQDGIFSLNRTGDVFPLFPGFRTLGFNPRPLGQWQGQYYFASDVGMVWEWNGDTIRSIGFDYAEAYPFPDGTYGLPNAATRAVQLPNFMLVGFNKFNSNNNACWFLAFDGTGWHPFHFDPNFQATGLGLTGGNQVPANPAIQFGKATWNNVSWSINYLTQPTLDPYLVSSYDTLAQVIFLPVDSGIISDEWKVLEGVRFYIENPTAGTVRVAYSSDDQIFLQNYVDLGAPIHGDRTTIQTFIPPSTNGSLPVYRKIMFKITLTPDANGATPIIRMVMHRYKQRESQRKSWKMVVLLEEGQMMPNRNKEGRTAQQMLSDLNNARKNRSLVNFKDLVGDQYWVYVESVGESLKTYRSRDMQTTFTCEVILVEPAEVAASS